MERFSVYASEKAKQTGTVPWSKLGLPNRVGYFFYTQCPGSAKQMPLITKDKLGVTVFQIGEIGCAKEEF